MRKVILIFLASVIILLFAGCKNEHVKPLPLEVGDPIEVYFCPRDNCEAELNSILSDARSSIHCALFDLDLKDLIGTLNSKSKNIDVKLVIDSDNSNKELRNIPTVLDDKKQYTHNKFCVIDRKTVSTGSFNPTENGNTKNNNNLVIIGSKYLAENYESEFTELWSRNFGSGEKVASPKIIYDGREIENYFCPEDDCAQHLINEILNAKESVYFMTFSFTDENIADAILMSNVSDIRGIFEKLQAGSQWSQYKRLKEFGIDVSVDNNSGMMHHKVFIIDNETVITGSYNPTSAGDRKNDENILIIKDKKLAGIYLEEFRLLINE